MTVAVVGAGWAGLAAAVELAQRGHAVTVFEAARLLGGRARRLGDEAGGDGDAQLDNGQHILIGAYTETLRLMRAVGVDPEAVLLRRPLVLRFPDGGGLEMPRWPAPLDAVAGILGARGWTWRDKASLVRASLGWQAARFRCAPTATVAALCRGLTPRVRDELIDPLCVSALNTPAEASSGTVFLRVIQDALFGATGGSHLLLPRADLGALFPDAAARWLRGHGGQVLTGRRVQRIAPTEAGWTVDGEPFAQLVLAAPPWEAERLVRESGIAADAWCAAAAALDHEAITTVYLQSTGATPARLALPMLALRSGPGRPAQFAFDRGQLGGPAGLLAFVISASHGEREVLQAQVLDQAREQLGLTGLTVRRSVTEKRATFACTPGLVRPAPTIAPRLWACGDYVDGPYPATLEGAVRSAQVVARQITASPGGPHA